MKIKENNITMSLDEYIKLRKYIDELEDEKDNYFNENYRLKELLSTYKHQFKILNRKIRDEKRRFYRNRNIFERFIDEVVLPIVDEKVLKQCTNLTLKDVKDKILKDYDEEIKYN